MAYIESGKKEGANCVIGGNKHGDRGYYIQPTVFTGVEDSMKIS
jgi:aldehyde dehydrogenase (NAD+)